MRRFLIAFFFASSAAMVAAHSDQPAQGPADARNQSGHHGRQGQAQPVHPPMIDARGDEGSRPPRNTPANRPATIERSERHVRSQDVPRRVAPSPVPEGQMQVHSFPRREGISRRPEGVVRSPASRPEHAQVPPGNRNPNFERRPPAEIGRVPRVGTQPPVRVGRRPEPRPQWNRDWRSDRRYNWQDWRRSHQPVFHGRAYHDPYGWGYRLFTIGWRLWPNYYSSGYWLEDPWAYHLPPAPPGTRWIRYYNDALLVDTWTGEIIDVVHNVFW